MYKCHFWSVANECYGDSIANILCDRVPSVNERITLNGSHLKDMQRIFGVDEKTMPPPMIVRVISIVIDDNETEYDIGMDFLRSYDKIKGAK